jgi:hypothetical protein
LYFFCLGEIAPVRDELFEGVIGGCRLVFGMSLYSWDEVPEERLREDVSRKIVSGERVMAAHVFLRKGAVVPAHIHDGEQLTYILDGLLELTLPGGVFRVGEGVGAGDSVVRGAWFCGAGGCLGRGCLEPRQGGLADGGGSLSPRRNKGTSTLRARIPDELSSFFFLKKF